MIKSNSAEVRTLIDALGAADPARREAAIARLIVIGNRAVGRLVAAADAASDTGARVAVLRVLEASGDGRALPVARRALAGGGDLAVAAVGVLRDLLNRGAGSTHAEALDTLLTLSCDPAVERRVKAAAAEALATAPDDIRRAVARALPAASSADEAVWEDAAEGRLPDDPASLSETLSEHAGRIPLAVGRRIIECLRDRERGVASEARRDAWRSVRGALHHALALRGSRVALDDLRETVGATATPLPPSFLTAIRTVGDSSCLEPLATAFSRAPAEHPHWRRQLADTFHAVATRERITRRHAAMRRGLAKAPGIDARSNRT